MDVSCRKTQRHILECPDYLALYQSHPEQALGPEAEYLRYREHDDSQEARELKRERRVAKAVAHEDVKREEQAERWARPDDLLA